jgi:hypothetical protein
MAAEMSKALHDIERIVGLIDARAFNTNLR